MYLIYSFFFAIGLVVVSPYYLVRFRRYVPTLRDRLGYLKLPQLQRSVWIHAVSVGEVKAIEKLIEKLRHQYRGRPIVVSTATPTGQRLAQERRDVIDHTLYFPFDLSGSVRRVLDRLDPEFVIIAETEIWPNFLRACRKRDVPVMMINGRISDRSFPRYRIIRRWLSRVLADYTVLGMQSETDRQRIEAIGADPSKVTVFGNLKYDVGSSGRRLDATLEKLVRTWERIWIAASTMPGEEEFVLDAFRELRVSDPALKLVIAPRHPERFEAVESLINARGFSSIRRTQLPSPADGGTLSTFLDGGEGFVLLLDTIGELAAFFEYATVVFMGGTLVPRGGHNILKPAQYQKPVVFGPHMENFRDIARLFLEANAAIQIQDARELASAIRNVLTNPELAERLGRSARMVVDQNTGATDRVLTFLRPAEARR